MRPLRQLTAALITGTCLSVAAIAPPALAQGLFEPLIKVNGQAITRYELEQRARLLGLLRAPAEPNRLAREQLIEDRLKLEAANLQGIVLSEEELADGMEQFAARGNLTGEQMIQLLERGGVDEETFREFVRAGLTWREVTRVRFGARISVSEEDLERARNAIGSETGVRVLLSEIIIPVTPETQEEVMATATRISELDSVSAFAAEARRFSATATRDQGGQMPWTPITRLPAGLRPLLLGLAPGEVTDPLPLDGAVALFQLRDIEEIDVVQPEYSAIEYAAYYIDGGRSEAALARAAQIDADTDTCDDLYGIAQGQPAAVLERGTKAPSEIPQDIAIVLSRLDPGEVDYTMTRANGQTLVLLMMCGRAEVIAEDPGTPAAAPQAAETAEGEEGGETVELAPDETAQLSAQIANQRMESFSDGYLEQLRSEARIIEY
ncbi:SurA N-terminal domain-containing protein [Roseovarius sp. LXJ103]|uniref:SurA N-terminal domain-containing protein n=1 Tax=Roseovarius carneus TaxID=2853164 RepID=UPI000D61C8F2|nr:SurA N-terminal domain-containing protein [Roseovarius carneus]MBZ8119504.1 SurA N-terminal domain-containing protein [Roseovarius carneus]PWE37167.1 peptidylprolyl isomerase [Pelagicola sp. LXJ1103]